MRELKVDMREILDNVESGGPFIWCLDLETGGLLSVADDIEMEPLEGDEETSAKIDADPERYEKLPRPESGEEYRAMERFAESIEDEEIRDLMSVALGGKGSFGRFRDVLCRYPDIEARWFADRERRTLEEVLRWFESIGIKPVYELKCRPEPPVPPPPPARVRLEHVLILGAPDGRTEMIDGKVERRIAVRERDEARAIFQGLARDICEYGGVAWRKSLIADRTEFALGGLSVRVEGGAVVVTVAVTPEIWKRFAR